jgi:uncharacterized protein with GYD domain
MPKILWKVSYSADGLKGLMKEGGSGRRDAARQLIESLGGTMESFYFAFGDTDAYVIADMPDSASAAAGSLIVSSVGAVTLSSTVLIDAEEMDAATHKSGQYRPPGA